MNKLPELANQVGADWVAGQYYADAEKSMDVQWEGLIRPMIADADFSNTLEIAAGHGRNTEKLLTFGGRVTAVDINETNVAVLEHRFAGNPKVAVLRNNGFDLRDIPPDSISFVYSFDAMVHFDSDVIRAYIREIARVLQPGGMGFCHYSNNDKNPTGTYRDHPGWRNFMSKALFEHWLAKAGLEVARSHYLAHNRTIVEGDDPHTDAVTLFKKPNDAVTTSDEIRVLQDQISGLIQENGKLEARILQLTHESGSRESQIAQLTDATGRSQELIAQLKDQVSQLEQENAELNRKLGSPVAVIKAIFARRSP